MQHTPPPWHYRPNEFDDWGTVRGGDRSEFGTLGLICQVRYPYYSEQEFGEHRRNKTDPWEANARLVAAAPQLYDAAEDALAAFKLVAAGLSHDRNVVDMIKPHIAELEIALAKARPTS